MQKRRRRNARRSRLCERREIRKDRRPKPGAFLGAQLASRTPWDSYNRCLSACVSNCRSARCCAKIYLPEFFLSGAGVAVANIPHSDCTVFTPVTGRQPSLIALGERFKALGSVYQLCVVFGNRQNKAVLAVLLTTSSYSAGCPMVPSASRCCAYRGKGGGVDMPDRGSYSGLARTAHAAQCGRAKAVSPARWSRRTMIPSPLLRRPAVAALAALAITWAGMV